MARHPHLLRRDDTAIVVIDVQEAFRPVIAELDALCERIALLAAGARALGVPVLVTEQYPKGLGTTLSELDAALEGAPRLTKTAFSAIQAPGAVDALRALRRHQLVLCGIETHICVQQTALDLLSRGLQVHVASDAVASRSREERKVALRRLGAEGVVVSSVESALFELCADAKAPEFRALQTLVKAPQTALGPVG